MNGTEADDARLPERAEALLEGWPAPPRGAVEWEDAANAIMARVRTTEPGSTPDELLASPLPRGEEEASLSVPGLDAEEPALADIARAVVADATTGPKDVARAGLLAAERDRRPVLVANDATDVAAGAAGLQGRLEPAPAPRGRFEPAPVTAMHAASAHSEMPAPPRPGKAPGFGAGLVGGAALAFAAAAALYFTIERREPERVLAAATSERTPVAGEAPAPPPARAAASAAAAVDAPKALAFDDLEDAPGKAAADKPLAAGPVAKDGLAFRVQNAPKGSNKLVLERKDEAEPAATATAAEVVAPAKEKKVAVAEPAQAGLAPFPSQGAIMAAAGSVLTGARSCLSGQEKGSTAEVTFGSDGRVRSVRVLGPPENAPSEGCIRSALSAARVPPFADASYTASLPIRPP